MIMRQTYGLPFVQLNGRRKSLRFAVYKDMTRTFNARYLYFCAGVCYNNTVNYFDRSVLNDLQGRVH